MAPKSRQRHLGWDISVLVLLYSTLAVRADPDLLAPLSDQHTKSFLIEFKGKDLSDGGSIDAIEEERRRFYSFLASERIQYNIWANYSSIMNGIAITLSEVNYGEELLSRSPDVLAVFDNTAFGAPSMVDASSNSGTAPDIFDSGLPPRLEPHNRTWVNRVHEELGVRGRGIKVGIIDSGIDYTHSAFGSCARVGAPGCRVAIGKDFVGDDYASDHLNPSRRVPVPDDDPMDCRGHGTLVAGVLGGSDAKLTGVAPDVSFGAYRIFGCIGSTSVAHIIAAMEQAFNDGMDIINLSLGEGATWPQGLGSRLANKLTDLGRVIVAATGNKGIRGLWQCDAPGLGAKAIAVGFYSRPRVSFSTGPLPELDRIHSQSSWGLAPDLALKPDLASYGERLLSALPGGRYARDTGSSMAAPYVSGIIALYMSASPRVKWSPADIKDALLNSALPQYEGNGQERSPISVAAQGGGMVNAFLAIQSRTRVRPSRLKLANLLSLPPSSPAPIIRREINVTNLGDQEAVYEVQHIPATTIDASVEGPGLFDRVTLPFQVELIPANFTLLSGQHRIVSLYVRPAKDRAQLASRPRWIYSGYVTIVPSPKKKKLSRSEIEGHQQSADGQAALEDGAYVPVHVPYAGFYGDIRTYKVLPTETEDPPTVLQYKEYTAHLDKLRQEYVETSLTPDFQSKGDLTVFLSRPTDVGTFTFNLETGDYPLFRTKILHPTPRVLWSLYRVSDDKQEGQEDEAPRIAEKTALSLKKDAFAGYIHAAWGLGMTQRFTLDAPKDKQLMFKAPYYEFAWTPDQSKPIVFEDILALRKKIWTPLPDGRYFVIAEATKPLGRPGVLDVEEVDMDVEIWRGPMIIVQTSKPTTKVT